MAGITKRWLGRMAVTLVGALALGVVGAIGPAAPANAAPGKSKLCWVYYEDRQLTVHCVDIQVQFPWDKYLECWMCGLAIDWDHDPVIRDELDGLIGEQSVKGLTKLGQAQFTTDPALRTRLRNEAMAAFTAAARYGVGSRTGVAAVGVADWERQTFDPSPDPWLEAAGHDVADGLGLLKQSFADPANAARYRALAAGQFDEAYAELSQQQVIGG
jgi:hypothetical protein